MMTLGSAWHHVCALDEIEEEDVISVEAAGRTCAVYRAKSGVFATDDLCTHGFARLSEGLVMGDIIECPLHQGRFHIPSGGAKSPPACENLRTYAVKVVDGAVFLEVPG
jgi:3-phenylpropionate/trans-cinnamate dioxygenase ferredoxin subunit